MSLIYSILILQIFTVFALWLNFRVFGQVLSMVDNLNDFVLAAKVVHIVEEKPMNSEVLYEDLK